MENKHLWWIITLSIVVGICIGYSLGIFFFVTQTLDHLDMIDTININFNETEMVNSIYGLTTNEVVTLNEHP